MKILDLVVYTDNNNDKNILNALNKSKDEEIIQYVINVSCDLLNVGLITKEFKTNALYNLNNFSDNEIGEIATYTTLTPYVQYTLQNQPNWQEIATSFLEVFIGYLIGTIDKKEFLSNLSQMKNLVNISDKFYLGLVIYFRNQHDLIKKSILEKVQ